MYCFVVSCGMDDNCKLVGSFRFTIKCLQDSSTFKNK